MDYVIDLNSNNKIVYRCVCGSVLRSNYSLKKHTDTSKHRLYIHIFNPYRYDMDVRLDRMDLLE